MECSPIFLKTVQKLGNRDPGWIDGPTALQFHDQASTLDLRFLLGALERMPAALALAGTVLHVDDDGPVTGRPLADMAPHFEPSFLLGCWLVSSSGGEARSLRRSIRSVTLSFGHSSGSLVSFDPCLMRSESSWARVSCFGVILIALIISSILSFQFLEISSRNESSRASDVFFISFSISCCRNDLSNRNSTSCT